MWLTTNAKPAEERDAFFKSDKVLKLQIEIDKAGMDSLRREPRKYVKATLKEGDKSYKDIGIHVKGAAGSTRGIDDKAGLTLNMDKFTDDQLFHGMDKFHLNNSVQDGSYVQELIAGDLMRRAGVPASRVSFATITINGKKRGFYYIKEGFDTEFLDLHFGNHQGNFYDGGFLRDIDQQLQVLSTREDVKNYADLKALIAASREKDTTKRFEQLEKLLNMDAFISYLALEAIMWDWDGYPMNRNNYRIYHDPKKDKITFIPSGMDQMFGDPNGTIHHGFNGMIARAVMETPRGKERYYARMTEIMEKVYDLDGMLKNLDELEKRITPALTAVDAGAGKDYKNQINRQKELLKQRAKSVNDQLKKMKK